MFLRATYDRDRKTVHYFDQDGNETLYIGGSFAWRTNNPGNLTKPGGYVMKSAIGYAQRTSNSKSLFVIFPDRATGQLAHQQLLKAAYGDSTIKGMVTKYAPPSENNTGGYIDFVTKKANVAPDDVVGSLSDEKFSAVSSAMEQQEGYVPGVIKYLGKPVQVQLLDKVNQPFSNQTMHIKSLDKSVETKTDQNGQLPLIYSGLLGSEISIYYGGEKDNPENVGSFSSGAVAPAYTFTAPYYLLSSRPRVHQTDEEFRPLVHIVRAGETVSSIAEKYGTTVDALVQGNGLIDPDHIYPQLHLRIPSENSGHQQLPSNADATSRASAAKQSTETAPKQGASANHASAGVTNQRNQNGHPETVLSSAKLELSGAAWCSRFEGSNSIDSLNPSFKSCVNAFFGALNVADVHPRINSALRPAARSYLMFNAFGIAKGTLKPESIGRFQNMNNEKDLQSVDIDWVHRSADGKIDLDASKKAAIEMCHGFGLNLTSLKQRVGRPWMSRHNFGAAIDINVDGYIGKTVKDGHGDDIKIKSFHDLKVIGQSYGVKYFAIEKMHWSDSGN